MQLHDHKTMFRKQCHNQHYVDARKQDTDVCTDSKEGRKVNHPQQ